MFVILFRQCQQNLLTIEALNHLLRKRLHTDLLIWGILLATYQLLLVFIVTSHLFSSKNSVTFFEIHRVFKLLSFILHPHLLIFKKKNKIYVARLGNAIILLLSIVYFGNCFIGVLGLYPLGSLANHRCHPNTNHVFDSQQRMVARAATLIKEGDEIFHSYTRIIWGTASRLYHLKNTKHFICKCKR